MKHNLKGIEADFDRVLIPGSIKGAMKEAGAGSSDLWKVPVSELRVIENLNPRVHNQKYKERIRWLADSMKSEGFYQHEPLGGYVADEGGELVIYIYAGHTRLLAIDLANKEGAGIETVPVVVHQKGLSMEDINIALINGNEGNPLSAYAAAIVCRRLVRNGMEVKEVARRTGFSDEWVNNLLLLMSAPAKLREMVADEVIAATLAIDTIKEHGERALAVLQEAVDRKASKEGKALRVTKKDLAPAGRFNKAVKSSAPQLYSALSTVTSDPGFASLSPKVQASLKELIAELDKAKAPEEEDPRQNKLFEGGENENAA